MKVNKLTVYREDGWEVGVELSNNLEKYALDFLHFFNNVKEQDGLIRIWNNYGNIVYVVSDDDTHDALLEYLKQFGAIKSDRRVQIMRVDAMDSYDNIRYDYDKYYDLVLSPILD